MIRMPTSRLRMQHFGPLSRLMTIARLAADPADLTAQDRPCCRNRRLRTEENPPWDPDGPSEHPFAHIGLAVADRFSLSYSRASTRPWTGIRPRVTAIPMTIFDVAVFGIPSEQWGEQVHAMLVLSPGAPLSEADVIAYARQHLAAYKLLPLGVRARARASCSKREFRARTGPGSRQP